MSAKSGHTQKGLRLLRGWEVEWCAGCPVVDGDTDIDAADMRFRDFATQAAAMDFARKVYKDSFFGCAMVNEFYLEPFEPGFPGLTREYVGQAIEVSSDEAQS